MDPGVSFKETKNLVCLFVVMLICFVQESQLLTIIAVETLSSSTLCRMYQVLKGLPFCDLKDLAFRMVKLHIPHLFPLFKTC